MPELIYEEFDEIKVQRIQKAEMIMKEIRIARWEQSKIVPKIEYLIDETNHELLVS